MVRNGVFDANDAVRGTTVRHLRPLIAAALLLAPAAVGAQTQGQAGAAAPSYDLGRVSQFDPSTAADTIPNDPKARRHNAEIAATEATIYGLPAVLQYAEMYAQAVDRGSKRYVGFNRFVHDRDLADPNYAAFKSPNSDTLYSNAWLDLTDGPVIVDVPPVPLKYYTLNFFDAYGNASNIGTRTFGSKGGRYLIAPVSWKGTVPTGVSLFRVATPRMWVLMRIFAQKPAEVALARALQDRVTITPYATGAVTPAGTDLAPPASDRGTGIGFMRILDAVLRTNGHPVQEDALVYQFHAIGIGGREPFDADALGAETKAGIEAGYQAAMAIIRASRSQLGIPNGKGWNRIEKGRYGFNYLNRATINYVGLGANVSEENFSFNTFVDAGGHPLDGSKATYALTLAPPPPVNAFWSVTLYDAATYRLHPNVLKRYLVNDRTPGLAVGKDGSVRILIQHDRPKDAANWLPAPDAPFYLALRAYLPKPELLNGRWTPDGVVATPIAAK
jgi:hypothetical protein